MAEFLGKNNNRLYLLNSYNRIFHLFYNLVYIHIHHQNDIFYRSVHNYRNISFLNKTLGIFQDKASLFHHKKGGYQGNLHKKKSKYHFFYFSLDSFLMFYIIHILFYIFYFHDYKINNFC